MFTGVRWTETVKVFTCGHMCSHACLQVCVLCECVCVCVCCKWLPVAAVIRTSQNRSCTKLRKITTGMAESQRSWTYFHSDVLSPFIKTCSSALRMFMSIKQEEKRREHVQTSCWVCTWVIKTPSGLLWHLSYYDKDTASFQLSSFLLIIKLTHFWLLFICSELTLIAQLNWYRIITTLFWLFSKCCFFFPATRHEMKADWWAGLHFYLASPL